MGKGKLYDQGRAYRKGRNCRGRVKVASKPGKMTADIDGQSRTKEGAC